MAAHSDSRLSRSLLVRQLPFDIDMVELESKLHLLFDFCSAESTSSDGLRYALLNVLHDSSASSATRCAARVASQRLGMTSAVSSVRIITDPETGKSAGYAKVDFVSHEQAKLALAVCGEQPTLPETTRRISISWSQRDGCPSVVDDFQVYVGNLSKDISEEHLYDFAKRYSSSVIRAKIISDLSGKPRGYGFIRFRSDTCAKQAAARMQGGILGSFPITVRNVYSQPSISADSRDTTDRTNTCVFLANVPSDITQEEVEDLFGRFGRVRSIRLYAMRNYCFVLFADREAAVAALSHMNGFPVRNQRLVCAWGRRRVEYSDIDQDEEKCDKEEAHLAEQYAKSLLPYYVQSQRYSHSSSTSLQDIPLTHQLYWLSCYAAP